MVKMRAVVEGLVVHPDRMLANLDRSLGLVFSQPVLLTLVASGLTRDEAYRVVQDAATKAWAERRSFRSVLEDDDRVKLAAEEFDDAFSLQRSLRNTSAIFDTLEGV
jgi:adenylosuccinate lyase